MRRAYPVEPMQSVERLSRRSELSVLAFCVALFLVVNGPIWRHPLDPSVSIVASYAPIPPLVAVCLLLERKLSLGAFLLETVLIAILKFGITAILLIGFLMLQPAASAPPAVSSAPLPRARRARTTAAAPRPASVIPAEETGSLEGSVADAAGRAQEGALVFLSAGLERFRFAPPAGAAALAVGGGRFSPPVLAIEAGQPLAISSSDGRLHTLDVRAAGRTVMNAPVLARPRVVTVDEPAGICEARCDVHPDERGTLVVLAHPFATTSDAAGRFALRGVPAGEVTVTAVVPRAAAPAAARAVVPARARRDVAIRLD